MPWPRWAYRPLKPAGRTDTSAAGVGAGSSWQRIGSAARETTHK